MELQFIDKKEIENLIAFRKGETKLGEKVNYANKSSWENIEQSNEHFVILGIKEDIGPRANLGTGGAYRAWEAFLKSFLNIQNNSFLNAKDVLILGSISCDLKEDKSTDELRKAVEELDDFISPIISKIVSAGKIPIVIGGGHNNSYPLIKGSSLALMQAINCINCDPHADYRTLEGRHSGNGFSYAKKENYLNSYSILGLHENYNSEAMLHQMKTENINFISYEDIFIREKTTFKHAISASLKEVNTEPFGVELDMDAIQSFPASARTPSGLSAKEARQFIHQTAIENSSIYLHLPETAPSEDKIDSTQVGKLLSYLVSDFIKAKQE